AQGVDFTFTQVDWSGGQSDITATHTDNQTDWNRYSAKDSNLSATNTVQLSNSAQTANIDFNTEVDYIQEDADSGTDFAGGVAKLHGVITDSSATYDPDKKNSNISLIDGNLVAQKNNINGWHPVASNATISGSNVYYWERVLTTGTQFHIGAYKEGSAVNWEVANSAGSFGWDFYYHYAFQVANVNIYESIATTATQGSVIGIAFQPSSGKIWSHKNGVWLGGKTPANSPDDPYYTAEAGLTWRPFDDIYWVGNQLTARNDLESCQYEPVGVVGLPAIPDSESYPTSQPYYLTTSDTSQFNTATYAHLAGVSLTQTTSANTSLKYLVSFDNRATWKYWDGLAWQTSVLDDLQTNGMDQSTLEGLAQAAWESAGGFAPGVTATLDFAVDLQTSSVSETPILDNISVDYTVPQTLTSSIFNTTVSGASLASLQWSESLPSNTDIQFQLRTSADGTNWGPWCG
ncbi:MAG: hypothetical protein U0944_00290, partial [Candidatus Moranbacteria bacterium]|nr:hypothetical protein [Candidatus Moranbacteria bacterium]